MPGPASSIRMYLGNLPPDISEKNIRERLKSFGRAGDVDIKHRKDHEGRVTATFAHFSLSLVNQADIEQCLQDLNQKKWNGYTTKAEVAKESYLQRMEAKRAQTQQTYSNTYGQGQNQYDRQGQNQYGNRREQNQYGSNQGQNQYDNRQSNNQYGSRTEQNQYDRQGQNQYDNRQSNNQYGNRQEENQYGNRTEQIQNNFKSKPQETFSTSKYSSNLVNNLKEPRHASTMDVQPTYSNKYGKKMKLQDEESSKNEGKKKKIRDKKKEEDSSDSEVEVFWQKNFQADKAVAMETEEQKGVRGKKNSSLLSKFESFSSVWNDTNAYQEDGQEDFGYLNSHQEKSYQDEFKVTKTPSRLTQTSPIKINTKKISFNTHAEAEPRGDRVKKNSLEAEQKPKFERDTESYGVATNGKIKWDPTKSVKQQIGEQKRVKSLAARMGVIQQQQEAVKKALAGKPLNKKIQFGEEEDSLETGTADNKEDRTAKEMAGKLFDDAESSEDEEKDDFAIKKQFEGKKGERLLELQSRFATDSRFRLDSRFKHSDSEREDSEEEGKEEDCDEGEGEQQKQLSILDSILEPNQKISAKIDKPKDKRLPHIVRFDPSKPEHEQKYTKVEEPREVGKKRKHEEAYEEVVMPEVSAERFYEVSSNLKQNMGKTDFSLRALFGHPQDKEEEMEEQSEPQEEEEERREIVKPRVTDIVAPVVKKTPTWSETFFLKPGDKRLQEGLDFFKSSTLEKREDFEKRRYEMWMAVKAKLRSVAKKKVTFERKLGGKPTKNKRFGGKKNFKSRK